MKKNRKIFYGWWILIACFFLSGGGVGILINSMGTFIKPVSEALNYSRAKLSLATSLSSFAGMLLYPVWGSYMKNHSIRKAMICTGFLIPLVFLAFSFCRQMWQFYLCAILIGCMTGSISTLPITTIINNWFEDFRGMATGIGTSGSGLSMIIVPIISAVIMRYGWQNAYRTLGLMYFFVIVPLCFFIIRDKPEDVGLTPYVKPDAKGPDSGSESAKWGLTRSEALKNDAFRYYLLLSLMAGLINTSIINHTYAFMTDIGMGEKHASLMVSLQMLSLMVSKLMLGTIMDKKGLRFGFMLSLYGYVLAGMFLMLGAYYTPMAYFAVVCSGIGGAIPAMSIAYTTRHLFGSREYSALCSVVLSFGFLGQTMGTTINGIIFDLTGSYKLGWLLVMAEALLMILLFLTVLKKTAHQSCGSDAIIANLGERR